MKTTQRNRTIAAGALAAVLAAGAGVAAIGTGAIALGGGSAGAAIVTATSGGTVTVTLKSDELYRVVHDTDYTNDICSGPLLTLVEVSCNTKLPKCALVWEKRPATINAVFDKHTGLVISCNEATGK